MIEYINSTASIWSKWMGHMFWQISLFIILIMLIDLAIRRRAWPYVRYVLWGLVFLKLLIPPTWQMPTSIVSLIQPKVSERIPAEYTLWYEESTLASEIAEPPQDQVAESDTVEKATWQTTLFLIWIAGMLFFVLMLAIQMSRLPKRSQKRHDRDAPEWFDAVLDSISTRLHLKKTPTVIFSQHAKSPAVFGLFRPVLVLPRGYFEDLAREEAEHVLLHEICHIKRGDLWVHWFCILLQIVYWFNPLLILARRQLGHVSEICCDLSVANVLKEKTVAYRETLLNTSRKLLADAVLPGIGLLGIFEEPSRIIARLKWLEKDTWKNQKRKIATAVLTALVMIFFVMPMNGLSQPTVQSEDLSNQPNTPSDESDGIDSREKSETNQPYFLIEALIVETDKEIKFKGDKINHVQNCFILSDFEISLGDKAFSDIQTGIQNLSNSSGVKILAVPKMLTTNIEKGSLSIARKLPAGAQAPSELPNPKPGITLETTSELLENGDIHQDLFVDITYETDIAKYSNVLDTEIQFREDEMIVLEIPSIESSTQSKLIMFMTSHIVESPQPSLPTSTSPPKGEVVAGKVAKIYSTVNNEGGPSKGNGAYETSTKNIEIGKLGMLTEPGAKLSQSNGFPNEDRVYEIYEVDTFPEMLSDSNSPPAFPIEVLENNITGKVTVEFIVTKEGAARNVWIVESEPPDIYDETALEAIRQWRFAPGTRNGEPVEVRLITPFSFNFKTGGSEPVEAGDVAFRAGVQMPKPPPESEDVPGISSVENTPIPAPAEGENDPRFFVNINEPGPVEDKDVHYYTYVQMPVKPPESEELRIKESGPLNAEELYTVGIYYQTPDSPPASEELREIPHHFEPKGGPEPNQKMDTSPIPLGFPSPQYPLDAARDKIEGRVVTRFMVDTDGKVKNPEVVEADPEGVFEESTLANIEQFEFRPATLDGEPVPCMMNYTLGFKLD